MLPRNIAVRAPVCLYDFRAIVAIIFCSKVRNSLCVPGEVVQPITGSCSGITRFGTGIKGDQACDQDRHIKQTSHRFHRRKPARSP
jgi:hypothetical protein